MNQMNIIYYNMVRWKTSLDKGPATPDNICLKILLSHIIIITSNNRRLESAFNVTRLFVLWQISIPASPSLWCHPSLQKNLQGMPDVGPKIHRPIHNKSHKISTQIRIRKRSSYVKCNKEQEM